MRARPLVWAGPILRRTDSDRIILWLAASQPVKPSLRFSFNGNELVWESLSNQTQELKLGEHCFIYLIDLKMDEHLPVNEYIEYDVQLKTEAGVFGWQDWGPDLAYKDRPPGFVVHNRISKMAHGSCRKPHALAGDGLVALDERLQNTDPVEWPNLVMMTGDQVYVDDVAGPMLDAIHQLIPHLGIMDENLPSEGGQSSKDIHGNRDYYYKRETLLPDIKDKANVLNVVFRGIRKPIFTTVHGGNHLISFAEVVALYLLCWSPAPWRMVELKSFEISEDDKKDLLRQELQVIKEFAQGLPQVQRLLAHLPSAMIFDDHDVTDDWNLSIAWENAAYNNPLAKRIIGNALLGYFIFQGWGNAPENFPNTMTEQIRECVKALGQDIHQDTIDTLLRFRGWDYIWPTEPGLLVLDTRTNRWRSERNIKSPSGLMDWESITDLQQELRGRKAVILVSPAPVFGVKLIESIQRVFTFFGFPLMVDAENWMAHSGAAYAIMNLFHHSKTPLCFCILSGDVHYSFVYKVDLRGQEGAPCIWQVTSSGIKNEFPQRLLDVFDRLNRWLYSPKSPLNWLTKRKDMRVTPLRPSSASHGERLLNAAGVGLVEFNHDGRPKRFSHLSAAGDEVVFEEE